MCIFKKLQKTENHTDIIQYNVDVIDDIKIYIIRKMFASYSRSELQSIYDAASFQQEHKLAGMPIADAKRLLKLAGSYAAILHKR